MKELPHAPCTGLICTSTGKYHACDPGFACVHQPEAGSSIACAYGGEDGCLPADAGAFAPKPIGTAPSKQQGACTTTLIDEYFTACLDPTTRDDTKCSTFDTANQACGQCMAQTATVVDLGTQQFAWAPNVGGCYAALDGTSASGSCAALDDANMQCAVAVCKDGCKAYPDRYERVRDRIAHERVQRLLDLQRGCRIIVRDVRTGEREGLRRRLRRRALRPVMLR